MPLAKDRLEVLQVRKLIQCVRTHDTTQISKMAEQGVPGVLDIQDPDSGESALHVAVSLNNEDTTQQLLDLGASAKVQDIQGCNAVMKACMYGHLQVLEILATRGLTFDDHDKLGRGPLFHCLYPTGRHAKCLSFLLECEADPNSMDAAMRPVLCAVCEGGYHKLLERLLDKGADPNARVKSSGKPAVVLAAEGNHQECVALLAVAGADLNAKYGLEELTALHRSAALGHFEVIQTLSAFGADFTASTAAGENAVYHATAAYKLLCVRLLGQRGCPTNETNDQGVTPQKLAKAEGMKDAMKELKKLTTFQDKAARGSKPKGYAEPWCVRLYDWIQCNKRPLVDLLSHHDSNRSGVMPTDELFGALDSMGMGLQSDDQSKLLKLYDKKGEGFINWDDLVTDHKYIHAQYKLGPKDDIKAKAKKGKKGKKGGKKGKGGKKLKIPFPIYYEKERPPTGGVPEGVIERELLLTDYQRFPTDVALSHSLVDDSPWYLSPQEQQYMKLYEACRHGNLDSLDAALRTGLPIDARDKYNKTPLMVACAHGRTDVAKFLLERGADVNAFDNFQWTALHHCTHAGEEYLVRLLLDAGAAVDAQSVNGGTPLMRAVQTSQAAIVKLLLERGAKVTIENKHGDTALEVARNWGDDLVYAIVYAKYATVPKPAEGKGKGKDAGKGKAKGGGKGKKGKKGAGGDSLPVLPGPPLVPLPPPARLPTPAEHMVRTRKKYSMSSLQDEVSIKPTPNYRPRPAWTSRPSTSATVQEAQAIAREEMGIEKVDFGELKSPFQLQILARVQAMEISDL